MIKQPNQKYKKVNTLPTDIISEWILIIGYMYNVGEFKILNTLEITFLYLLNRLNYPFNEQIIESIRQKEVIAAVDALVNYNEIGVV